MSVVVAMESLGPCRRQLKVEVPAAAVDAEYERVVGEFGRQAKVPGFRQGKVPVDVVRRRFRQEIEQELVERLVPRFWRQAEAESQVRALLPPRLADIHLHLGQSLTFVATVETPAEIELREVRDLELPELSLAVEPGEVENALDDVRRSLSDWIVVERAAGRGDVVASQIVELLEDREAESDPVAFEIGDGDVWDELSTAASGLAAGQSAQFERVETGQTAAGEQGAATGSAAAPAERRRRFRVTVREVRERKLPALDDEFAKRVGNFAHVEALKKDIEARLVSAKSVERARRREQAALDQLRDRYPMPLPEGVVENEQESLLRDYAENLARRGVDVEHAKVDWSRLAGEIKPQAERRVHARLLLDAIADRESVTVAEEQLERTLVSLARAEATTAPALRQALSNSGRLDGLRAQLRRERTLHWLLGEEEKD
jgi:trigger factor